MAVRGCCRCSTYTRPSVATLETASSASHVFGPAMPSATMMPLRSGGGGDSTRFVCGYMACDPLLCAPILLSIKLG